MPARCAADGTPRAVAGRPRRGAAPAALGSPVARTRTSPGRRGMLADRGVGADRAARQIRTWNLSSIWGLPIDGGDAWLKVVPPFFAHEGAMLGLLRPAPRPAAPRATTARASCSRTIPGEDRYDAEPRRAAGGWSIRLVDLQAAWHRARADELLAIGHARLALARALARRSRRLVERDGADARRRRPRDPRPRSSTTLPARIAADRRRCGLPRHVRPRRLPPGQRPRRRPDALDDPRLGRLRHRQPAARPAGVPGPGPGRPSTPDPRRVARRVGQGRARGSDPRARRGPAGARSPRPARPDLPARSSTGSSRRSGPYHQADVPDWLRRTAAIVRAETAGLRPVGPNALRESSGPTWQTVPQRPRRQTVDGGAGAGARRAISAGKGGRARDGSDDAIPGRWAGLLAARWRSSR